jgi:catalase
MIASKPDPTTGKPDPAKMKAFLASHPETERALAVVKSRPPASGFENSTFYALHAFRFTDAAGTTVPVRWQLKPEQPFSPAAPEAKDKNYLFDGLIAALHQKPLRWHLVVTVGQPGDPTDDPTVAWPDDREKVDAGTLTLDQVVSDDDSPATPVNFDPLVLPPGITPAADPVLLARSAVYSQSFTRRAGEAKPSSPITPAEVHKGE